MPYAAPSGGVPAEVVELVEKGDRIGAIKKYRELTGAEVDAAKEVIAGI